MKTLTLTPTQFELLESHTNFTSELSIDMDDRITEVCIFCEESTEDENGYTPEQIWVSYSIDGANNISNYTCEGMDFSQIQKCVELINALEKGDVVVNMDGEEFLVFEQNDENFQLFLTGKTDIFNGWLKKDGTPEDGVTKGEYYLCDDNGNWCMTEAVWSKNQDCLTPYELQDFRDNGSFFEIK